MILQAVRRYGSAELLDEVLARVYRGEIRFAMGYTEPEGGSDIATCKTRAERDGDDWVINGQKMFTRVRTPGQLRIPYCAHRSLTRHKALGASPCSSCRSTRQASSIHGMRTVDGERTNVTYYSDVRIPDKYRLGEVDDGWRVLSGPLAAEHGAGGADPVGLGRHRDHERLRGGDGTGPRTGSSRRAVDDESVAYRLGRGVCRGSRPRSARRGIFWRVAIAQTMRDVAPDLMDVLGPAAALPSDTEYLYRWAPLIGIYGGTIDVFRQHDRSTRPRPGSAELLTAEEARRSPGADRGHSRRLGHFTEGPTWMPDGRVAVTSISHGCVYVIDQITARSNVSTPAAGPTVPPSDRTAPSTSRRTAAYGVPAATRRRACRLSATAASTISPTEWRLRTTC